MAAENEMPAIIMHQVRFSFPDMAMEFDLKVAPKQITIVTGPSGSGKSTLLNLVAGFETPASGRIVINGIDCTGLPISARPVSILFQEHNLFAHLCVETNTGFGIAPRRIRGDKDRQRVAKALASVGLEGKGARLPHQLSGGERQRAAFARVLLEDRAVLLLDEPFASLGPSLRLEMMDLLVQLQAKRPRTILAVTHHPQEWDGVANNFVFVNEGRVLATGTMADMDKADLPDSIKRYLGTVRQ